MYKIVFNMLSGNSLKLKSSYGTAVEANETLKRYMGILRDPTNQFIDTGNGVIRVAMIESMFLVEDVQPTADSNQDYRITNTD